MKKYFIIAALLAAGAANAEGPIQYPPGSSPAAIAVNEMARAEAAVTGGVKWCLYIDTRDPRGRCLETQNLSAGGGTGPGAGATGGGGGGGPQ